MKITKRPQPIDREIVLDPFRTIMSKTDRKGVIEFANDYFMEVAGYKEWELMGQPHNIIRHPDMPKIIFKLLWDRLYEGKNIHAIVKNLSKDGSYYWVVTDFQIKYDSEGDIRALYSRRKAIPDKVKYFFSDFYRKLLQIEEKNGIKASYQYLLGFLEDHHTTYDEFILDLFDLTENQLNDYMKAQIKDADLEGSYVFSPELAIKKSTKRRGFFKKMFK